MMKFLRYIIIYSLIFFTILFFIIFNISGKENELIDNNYLSYYSDSYEESRGKIFQFIKENNNKFDSIEYINKFIPSANNDNYCIDCFYIPARSEKKSLIVMTSGIHGIEGFYGNAVLSMVINELTDSIDFENTGLLLISNVNPFGMKNFRRYTENCIDLNRNMPIDESLFQTKNSAFEKLYDFLNPKGKLSFSWFKDECFFLSAAFKSVIYGKSTIREAAVKGQYQFNTGIYYGGNKKEIQVDFLDSIISAKSYEYKGIFSISLHTAYGERGRVHFWGTSSKDSNLLKITDYVFKGYSLDFNDTEDFYQITGDFESYLENRFYPDKKCLVMTFEAGTLNSQDLSGSIKLLHYSIIENQGFHYGYKSIEDSLELRERVIEMYCPKSKEWRYSVIKQTKEVLPVVIRRFNEYLSKDH